MWNCTARLAGAASRMTTSSTPLRTLSPATPSKIATTSLAGLCCSAPTAGNILELVALELDDARRLVIHAMPMRPMYRDLLPQPNDT